MSEKEFNIQELEAAAVHTAMRSQVIDRELNGVDDVQELSRIADEFDGITQGPLTCNCRRKEVRS